jgi:mannose-1-phosphate guanylyltransferase / mannose-6-phosphate isomerase
MLDFAPHITMTNTDYRFIISEQLQEVGIDPGAILIEPEAKNTASPILAASLYAFSLDDEATLLVAPSDHIIPDTNEFHSAIKVGLSHIQNEKIVTFGINPTHPETGYGYLELSKNTLDNHGVSDLKSFIEKPNTEKAAQMLDAGNFLWNAGIFLFRAKDMIDAFSVHAPETLELVSNSVANATLDLGFLRLASEQWSQIENTSIDYAIMENVRNLVCVPFNSKWSDLGDWSAVWSESDPDHAGNVRSHSAHAVDCSNSLLRTESSGQQLVGIGLENILVVATPDAVLVAHKNRSQDVKKAVELLKKKNIVQSEILPIDHRPWGWFESLIKGDRFQVKRISVKPGEALSLQSHNHRSEHWIVVEGTAKVTIDNNVRLIAEGESVYVPLGATHRMENPGKLPMLLIEVQIGSYLGEDDIIRYEDNYSRNID